jgi:Glycosyl hydrolase catalytic core
MRTLVITLLALSLLTTATATAKAPKKVPAAFMGVVGDGPLLYDSSVDLPNQFDRMVGNGVQTLRLMFNWSQAQPYQSFDQVPPDQRDRYRDENGVPTDYTLMDQLVTAAATRHIALLPEVQIAPAWAARHPGQFASPPADPEQYAAFMGALTRRYGPGGTFWTEHTELVAQPLRYWQIWNEPSFNTFWSDQPFAEDYVALVRASRNAIKAVDPGAKVVLAGLPNKSWNSLEKIYKAGGRNEFDIAAFHPFTAKVDGVKTILQKDRKVMAKYGDSRKTLWVTEMSWTSAKGKTTITYGNEQTEKGQAKNLKAAYDMLARNRGKLRIGRVYWYTWLSRDQQRDYPFDWAGLFRIKNGKVTAKPALKAFRQTAMSLQRCRAKKGRADRCAH